MPKKLEYTPSRANTENINVTDQRNENERSFQEKVIDGETTHFYGDDSFGMSLIEIIRNRLAFNHAENPSKINIKINKIILASSINNTHINEQSFNGAAASSGAGIAPRLIALPIISLIEQSRALRSIWCQIYYTVNNEEFAEKNIGSAKNEDLKQEVPQVLLRSIDEIYKSRFPQSTTPTK